ncbi:MAG: DNA-binding protein [Clostridia bacterium]|nr:DNA-binding protein [Clostridia bacterium]
MEYRKFGTAYAVRMDRGEEILSKLTELCEKESIRFATVEALGAVDHAVLCVYDVPSKTFFRHTFDGPMEIGHLAGSITTKNGSVYLQLHGTVCDQELNAHGGHINEMRVSATCEMFIHTMDGT